MSASHIVGRVGVRSVTCGCLLLLGTPAVFGGPQESAISAAFAAAVEAYNGRDIDGFMAFFSPSYLDDGQTFDTQRSETLDEWSQPDWSPIMHSVDQITVDGSLATVVVTFSGVETETFQLRNEGGNWLIYGNQQRYGVQVTTGREDWDAGSVQVRISLNVRDPADALTAVAVSGPGIDGSVSLNYNADNHEWVSWNVDGQTTDKSPVFTDDTRPAVGTTYLFSFTDGFATPAMAVPISGYVDSFPENLAPASGTVVSTATPTFSWTADAGYRFRVEVADSNWSQLWSVDNLTDMSQLYGGPPLTIGGDYHWSLAMNDSNWNASRVNADFTYNDRYLTVSPEPLDYTENDGPVAVDGGLSVSNISGGEISQATVTISDGFVPDQDTLTVVGQSGLTGQFSTGTGRLTITGSATALAYELALRSVAYTNDSENPSTNPRVVSFQFSDAGAAASAVARRTITVAAVNDPPTLSTVAILTGAVPDSDYAITEAFLRSAADLDDVDSFALQFRIESVSSGSLTKTGQPVTAGVTLLAPGETVVWRPAAGASGTLDAFTVRAWDGSAASTAAVQVQVTVAAPAEIEVSQGATTVINGQSEPISFGTAEYFGTPVDLAFAIIGHGGVPLRIGTVVLRDNTGFAVIQQPAAEINPESATTFVLRLLTAAAGGQSAQVTFTNSDPLRTPFRFAVSGTINPGVDSDQNGLADAWEQTYFGHLGVDPDADADGDGYSNRQELERGTDPTAYVLHLRAGWNLISLARIPRLSSVASILDGHVRGAVWAWAGLRYVETVELEPLQGYWAYAETAAEIPIVLP